MSKTMSVPATNDVGFDVHTASGARSAKIAGSVRADMCGTPSKQEVAVLRARRSGERRSAVDAIDGHNTRIGTSEIDG